MLDWLDTLRLIKRVMYFNFLPRFLIKGLVVCIGQNIITHPTGCKNRINNTHVLYKLKKKILNVYYFRWAISSLPATAAISPPVSTWPRAAGFQFDPPESSKDIHFILI